MAVGQQAHPAMGGMTGLDVWRVLRANVWLILGLFVLSGVAGYLLNGWLLTHYPRYTSTVLVSVRSLSEIPTVGTDDSGKITVGDSNAQSIELEQQSQASMISNKFFLSSIIEDKNSAIRNTGWFKQYAGNSKIQDAKEELLSKLEVYPRPNTRLISVSMSTDSANDSLTIVKEIVERHVRERTDSVLALTMTQSNSIGNLTDQIKQELSHIQTQMNTQAEIMAKYGSSGGSYQTNGLGLKLATLTAQYGNASKESIEAENKLSAFIKEIDAGYSPMILQEALAKSNQSQISIADQIKSALASERINHGSENIRIKQMEAQLKAEQELAEDRDGKRRDDMVNSIKNELLGKVATANLVKKSIEDQGATVDQEMQLESKAEINLNSLKDKEKNLLQQVARLEQQSRSLDTTIRTATSSTTNSSTSTASMVGGADLPDKPVFPRLPITMSVSITLGLALALGIAFLREFMDTSVRSPRDIARVGQLNLLGMIPHESDDPEAQTARLPLAIFEAPTSIIAEQFRQVRTRLQHSASLDTVRSLLITGTAPGDGKTTVACNLAAGLALNGRRILLVDANFRRPQIHAVLNIPNEVGFGDVLNSLDMFESAVRETEVPNLSVLPTGIKPANSTELLESQLLIDFIERALEEYDHVIFDSGPLLLVSETSALAPRVDGVVTVVRARGNSRGMLQRLRDQLRQLKAENLGVILNAVRSQSGGYYAPMIKSYYAYQQPE
jgi:capsular exopolysaccharide synthesis family protein